MTLVAFAIGATLACITPHVHDGDTLTCAGQRVRLWGIDAPELQDSPRCRQPGGWACDPMAMAWGLAARDRLIALTRGQVRCEIKDRDRYRRVVARCFAGGQDVDAVMVREGLARDYTRFSRGAYLGDETRARRQHLGIWR